MNAKELNNRLLPVVIQRIRGMGLQVYDSVGNFVLIDFGSAERSTAADASCATSTENRRNSLTRS